MQFVLGVTTIDDGKEHMRKYNTDVFTVFGGKYKLRQAIENKIMEIRDLFENDSNKELVDLNSRDYTLTT